jgi:integrase
MRARALGPGAEFRAGLQWMRNTTGGWIDLKADVIYRRAVAAAESRKRKPPVPIASQLKPHLVRWRKHSARWVVEYEGRQITGKLRRSWHSARKLAGLGPDVLPRILRHTCATWLLQEGESFHDVAGVLGTSEDVIRDTYGHHAHDGLRRTVEAFSRRRTKGETAHVSPRKSSL